MSTNGVPNPAPYISGQNGVVPTANTVAGGGTSGGGYSKNGTGKTTVISTADGITDVSKMSATVNGSTDNYVIKITKTDEANMNAVTALSGAYGDLNPIRYVPVDISLYDSTGTTKIHPVPPGLSVSVTMPIPDDLSIYGGNVKVACTEGGQLEKIQPRFTVINGVPCMTFTATQLCTYVIYVDTNNLTEAGISDATPKTADGVHPKWFLCGGLASLAIVLFLKRDPEEYMRKSA